MAAAGVQAAKRGHGALLLAAALVVCGLWGWPSAPTLYAHIGADEVGASGGGIGAILRNHSVKLAAFVYLVCFMLAKREPPAPKIPPAVTPLDQRRDASRVVRVSVLLSLVSGIVNAVAIIEMGGTVAHHTGNASHAGRLAGSDGARFAALMIAYLAGAAVVGYCKSDGEAVFTGHYSPAMVSGGVAVVAGALIHGAGGSPLVALPLLSFSQGIQNAITRKCSSLPVCTTHMTGYLTDAGSSVGDCVRNRSPVPMKTKFFIYSIFAFIFGGFLAKMLLDKFGILVASFLPAAAMFVMGMGVCTVPRVRRL